MPKLSQQEKVTYLDFALKLTGFAMHEMYVDLIVNLYDGVLRKGGKLDLKDIAQIKADNCGKYPKEFIEEENKKAQNS